MVILIKLIICIYNDLFDDFGIIINECMCFYVIFLCLVNLDVWIFDLVERYDICR